MAKKETWNVTMWRGNPQLKNGGRETVVKVEAATAEAAMKKADKVWGKPAYGTYTPLRAELAQ